MVVRGRGEKSSFARALPGISKKLLLWRHIDDKFMHTRLP